MKIDQVTLYHIKMPFVFPFQTSHWTEYDRECVIVQLRADGFSAWGECVATQDCAYSYETVKTNWILLEDFLIPALFANDLDSVESFRTVILHVMGHPMAKVGLEMALWDLFAQRAGTPLQTYLGGSGDRVKVGVSVGIQPTTAKLLEVVENYLSQGYKRVKFKIKPGRDVEDTRAIRQAHPDLLLQVDANSINHLWRKSMLSCLLMLKSALLKLALARFM